MNISIVIMTTWKLEQRPSPSFRASYKEFHALVEKSKSKKARKIENILSKTTISKSVNHL